MKYKIGDVVLLKGTITDVDDSDLPYTINFSDPDSETWATKSDIFALVSRARKPKAEPEPETVVWHPASERVARDVHIVTERGEALGFFSFASNLWMQKSGPDEITGAPTAVFCWRELRPDEK